MRSELPNTYSYSQEGDLWVRARTPEEGVSEFIISERELVRRLDYVGRDGQIRSREVYLKPAVPRVTRLDTQLTPLQIRYLAARVCYDPLPTEELIEEVKGRDPQEMRRFLQGNIFSTGHHSIIEHPAGPTFVIEGISRATSHQLVRHRLASFSQESQRYVEVADFAMVIPPRVRSEEGLTNYYLERIWDDVEAYYHLRAKGSFPEDARMLLPNAAATRIVVSANLRELRHIIKERTCARAQWEIDIAITELARLLWEEEPSDIYGTGPDCCRGSCRQGKRTCGVPLREPLDKIFEELAEGQSYPHDRLIFGGR